MVPKRASGRACDAALAVLLAVTLFGFSAEAQVPGDKIYDPGKLPGRASQAAVKAGEKAPDFTLPSVEGTAVTLSDFHRKKNVVISFVPAAWTPVCSQQWPGYNIAEDLFKKHDAILLGITVDNIPTLHAWTETMGDLWFAVLSDFWPHGRVAKKFGVLRSDGVSERALFIIDKEGIVRYVDVHDINEMPRLEELAAALGRLPKQ